MRPKKSISLCLVKINTFFIVVLWTLGIDG